jgi:hypothetical protein
LNLNHHKPSRIIRMTGFAAQRHLGRVTQFYEKGITGALPSAATANSLFAAY